MSWDVIAAISQLVAAIGVILSFFFLAIQLRQNTKAIQSSAIQNLVHSLSCNAQTHVENEYLVPLMLKANAGIETLSELERARLHFWFLMAFRRFEGVYFQRCLGLVDAAVTEGFERSHVSILASKSGRAWWPTAKAAFACGFVAYVDDRLSKVDGKSLHPAFLND